MYRKRYGVSIKEEKDRRKKKEKGEGGKKRGTNILTKKRKIEVR